MELLAALSLISSDLDTSALDAATAMHAHSLSLSQQERDQIWMEIHLAYKKMHSAMNMADAIAWEIPNVSVREATIGAIEGAIAGLAGRSACSVIIGGCLGAIAKISGEAYRNFCEARDHVREAEKWAKIAEALQEKLWRDE